MYNPPDSACSVQCTHEMYIVGKVFMRKYEVVHVCHTLRDFHLHTTYACIVSCTQGVNIADKVFLRKYKRGSSRIKKL